MRHTQIPSTIDRAGFKRWGEGMMRIENKFDLNIMFGGKCSPSNVSYEAEEAACAMGYAVWHEIGSPQEYELQDSITGLHSFEAGGWNSYSMDIVGGDIYLGNWIGSQHWSKVDNTAKGAGQRILYALEHGVPFHFEMMDMMQGKKELCYKDIEIQSALSIDVRKWFNVSEMESSLESV